jgi:flagellar basal body-associated protein FliL
MNRFALVAVALVAILIAAVVIFNRPTVQSPPAVPPPTVVAVAPDAMTIPVRPPDPAPPVPETNADGGAADTDAADTDAAVEPGPYRVELGEHSILLAERDGRFLRVGVTLVTPTIAGRAELGRRRRELLRMLYFLGSHRSAEAVALPDAEARFDEDLTERFGNAVRSGAIADVVFTRFEIERREMPTPPDAGPP